MKKQILLLACLFPILGACSDTYEYTPRMDYPGADIDDSDDKVNPGETGEEIDPEDRLPMKVYFYIDFAHADNSDPNKRAVATLDWYMLTPIPSDKIPEEARLKDSDALDPLYPHFLGYSRYSTCLDEEKLWKFDKDYYQGGTLNLYGIWVSN